MKIFNHFATEWKSNTGKVAKEPSKTLPSEIKKKQESDLVDIGPKREDKDYLLHSDVGVNDPRDPTTYEKLKKIMSTGTFKFSDREREVLEKILDS